MPLGILNNIPSLQAENELTLTSTSLNNTLEQLASGSRINSGADDPAGLAIANGLQANISALTQSVSNANDGVGELQLADGALAQVTNLLNTAITLATESATGTVSNEQRTAIQAQYSSILAEINQIGTATTYNGQSVFQSGTAPNLNAADSANSATAAPVTLGSALTVGDATSVTAGGVTFTYTAAAGVANPNVEISGGTALTAATALTSAGVLDHYPRRRCHNLHHHGGLDRNRANPAQRHQHRRHERRRRGRSYSRRRCRYRLTGLARRWTVANHR